MTFNEARHSYLRASKKLRFITTLKELTLRLFIENITVLWEASVSHPLNTPQIVAHEAASSFGHVVLETFCSSFLNLSRTKTIL